MLVFIACAIPLASMVRMALGACGVNTVSKLAQRVEEPDRTELDGCG